MVSTKEVAPIDSAGRKIVDLRDLLDEAVARYDGTSSAELFDGGNGHEGAKK
jgi:hypothetical protein